LFHDQTGSFFVALLGHIGRDNFGPFAGERQSCRAADAAPSPSYECNFTSELTVFVRRHALLPFLFEYWLLLSSAA
jgi:hypothetical protein